MPFHSHAPEVSRKSSLAAFPWTRAALALIAWFLLPSSMPLQATSIQVTLTAAEQVVTGGCSRDLTLKAQPGDGELDEPLSTREWKVQAPTEVWVDLDRQVSWLLSVTGEGCWSPRQLLAPGGEPLAVIPVWPVGTLSGKVVMPRNQPELAEVEVRFESVPPFTDTKVKVPAVPETTVSCPITQGKWQCNLPSVALDLRLEVQGFVPHYLWNVTAPAGKKLEIDPLRLVRGASVAGWVRTEDFAQVATTLELAPEVMGGRGTPTGKRLMSRTQTAHPTERGFFQFKNLATGNYVLVAKPEEDYSTQRVAPIEVAEEREYLLESEVVLARLSTLEVWVVPPVDPYLEPWEVELERDIPLSSYVEDVARGPVGADGSWVEKDLEDGSYSLRVHDSLGSNYLTERGIDLPREDSPVVMEVPVIPVEGRISRGQKPFETALWFKGLDGRKIKFESDQEGSFEGYLSREGEWRVDTDSKLRGSKTYIGRVYVKKKPGQEKAWIDLTLPDTRIHGKVLDDEGREVEPSLVTIFSAGAPELQVWSDENGAFEALGLPPGTKQVRGEDQEYRDSGFVPYELEEGEDGPFLELTVRNKTQVKIKIVAPSGPVPGARVRFSDPTFPQGGVATSGPRGTLSLFLTQASQLLDLVVLTPGLPGKMARVALPADPKDPVVVGLERVGGRLTFRPSPNHLLVHNGAEVPWWWVVYPPTGMHLRGLDPNTGNLTVEMEKGEYALCPVDGPSRNCVRGYLPMGGSLTLMPDHGGEPEPEETESPPGHEKQQQAE